MNLLSEYQEKFFNCIINLKKSNLIDIPEKLKDITVELPPKNLTGDISCNAAMLLAKFNKKSPLIIGNVLKKEFLDKFVEIEKIDVVSPGFLNISFNTNFWKSYLYKIIDSNLIFGSEKKSRKKYNIEFVSANPTGPLHVGHCRGAILGDTLANLLKFNGQDVTKEYYVNDYGNQIKNFVNSVYYRILELKNNEKFPSNEDLYPGSYVIDIAKAIIKKNNIKNFKKLDKIYETLMVESLDLSIQLIKDNLNDLGIKHDNFIYESSLIKNESVSKIIKKLQESNFVYEGTLKPPKGDSSLNWKTRNQLLFNSTKFGDDTDRALQKEDKSWTYFAGDIGYHSNKIDRKFDILINILGADHSGYIKRISAAVKAISDNKVDLVCKVSQLVKLFKKNKPFKMSKRKGDYITVKDLVKEVGKDSVRFMMLNRSSNVELEFDFEKVSEKSKENPVFYVQYAYARINSIFRILKLPIENKILSMNEDFCLNKYEIEILKKISEWPRCVETSLHKLEPHRIPFYLYDLSTLFHSYWNLGNENKEFRFISGTVKSNNSRLQLLQALSIVIKNGMKILGVSTPKIM